VSDGVWLLLTVQAWLLMLAVWFADPIVQTFDRTRVGRWLAVAWDVVAWPLRELLARVLR
jgi:hypothetical protein